jgi:hypothetical protein
MGRGQNRTEPRNDPDEGWSKQELLDAAAGGETPLSAKTFDLIRKAARVRGPSHGGNTWVFSVADVIALVKRAESGGFSDRGRPAAAAWRELLAERGITDFD